MPPPQPTELVCETEELTRVDLLFTIPRGSLYMASHRGEAALFVDETSMTDWPPFGPREELNESTSKVFVFASPEDRLAFIAHHGWDRLGNGYLEAEMRWLYDVVEHGRGSNQHFEAAYRDARDAIQQLPCEECGRIEWPVIAKPEPGSFDWWDDPGPYFACRHCGRYLTGAFSYPISRRPTDRYPFEGLILDPKAHPVVDPEAIGPDPEG